LLAGSILLFSAKKADAQSLDKIVTGTVQVWPGSVAAAGTDIDIYATPQGGNQRMRTGQ